MKKIFLFIGLYFILIALPLYAQSNTIQKSFVNMFSDNVTIKPLIDTINYKLPNNSTKIKLSLFLSLKTETFYHKNYEASLIYEGNEYQLDGTWGGYNGYYHNYYGFYATTSLPFQNNDIHSLDNKSVTIKLKYIPTGEEFSFALNVPNNFFKEKSFLDNISITYNNNIPFVKWDDPDNNTTYYRIRIKKNCGNNVYKIIYASPTLNETQFDFDNVNDVFINAGEYLMLIESYEYDENIPANFFNRSRTYTYITFPSPIMPNRKIINNLSTGWNLLGWTWYESTPKQIIMNNNIKTMWKWNNGWCIWSPDKDIMSLISDYDVCIIKTIKTGEGFWINK